MSKPFACVTLLSRCRTFAADQNGATAIEYALIAAGIAAAIITTVTNLGTNVSDMWQRIADAM